MIYYTDRTGGLGDRIIETCATIVILFGSFVMLGWFFHYEPLIKLSHNFPPTKFNAALLLVAGGIGIHSAMRNLYPLTYFCGGLLFSMGFLTIIEYKIGWNFGIDQLFMTDYLNTEDTVPGRIGIYTAYCFASGGLALLLIHTLKCSTVKQISIRLLGTIILALANVALFGIIMGTEVLNEWLEFSHMETHLTPVLQIYSLAIIGYAWVHCGIDEEGLPPMLPIPATFGVLLGTLFLWHALKTQEILQIYNVERSEAVSISSSIHDHMDRDVVAIRRTVERWEVRGGTPKKEWEADAQEYINDVAGINSLHWVDRNYRLQWSVPESGTDFPIIPLKLDLEDLQQVAMEDARDMDTIMITKMIEGGDSTSHLFIVYSPIVIQGEFDGWIVGVFDLKKMIEKLINQTLQTKYHISIRDGNRFIYDNELPKRSEKKLLSAAVPFKFSSMKWTISVCSTPQTYEDQRSILPTFNLVVGVIMSLFVGLSVYFAQRSHLRSNDLEKAINALRDSKNRMEVILHSIGEGILGLNTDGKTLFINPSGASMFGYDVSEIEGKSIVTSTVSKPYDSSFSRNITPIVNADRKGELESSNEGVFWKKDGTTFPVEYTASPLYQGKDNKGTVIVFRDVTYRKQVEAQIQETQQRFKAIIDNADSIIYVKDLTGNYMIVNKKFLEIVQLNEDEILGKSDHHIFNKNPADTLRKNDVQVIQSQKAMQFEEMIPQKDQDHTYISVKVPLYDSDNQLYGISCIATDITERKNTEMQMQNYLKQIENTNIELAEARRTAEQANIAKSSFLANMSHEIRTPLNGVIGTTSILLNMELDEKQKKFVNLISLSGNMLLDIINDILDFSKIEAGKLKLESIPCDVRSIVEEVHQIMSSRASDKQVSMVHKIDPTVPESVISDPTRIRQVLTNLIGNAIKFTENGGITISLEAKEITDDIAKLSFKIADTGIGIPPEVLPELFHKFTQADVTTTRKFGGTGLGLAICKELVALMGGEINVESEVGKGSIFSFEIPFQLKSPEKTESATGNIG